LTKFIADIDRRNITVGIIGLGSIGRSLAVEIMSAGFNTIGFDENPLFQTGTKQSDTKRGWKGSNEQLKYLKVYNQMDALVECDIIIICVPATRIGMYGPKPENICNVLSIISAKLKQGRLIVIESTVYPGFTQNVAIPILESSGLKSEIDFLVAYSPSRYDIGNNHFNLRSIPKILAGAGNISAELACCFYRSIFSVVFAVSTLDVAEAAKLLENTFRSVNIAFIDEFRNTCNSAGIDVWEVIDAAATKPFGFMRFEPGPGVGGSCIPVDPHYFIDYAGRSGVKAPLIESALCSNQSITGRIVGAIAQIARFRLGKDMKDMLLLIVGVSYKKNILDIRRSPGLEMWSKLTKMGAQVVAYDPLYSDCPYLEIQANCMNQLILTDLPMRLLECCDIIIIVTDHDIIDYGAIFESEAVIIDTRNAMRSRGFSNSKIVRI
jgi:UDP-N-acetyl-D-glucosamine dehydrogenase